MKKLVVSLLTGLLLLAMGAPLLSATSDFKIEKDITVADGQTYDSSIISLKGKLIIKGTVKQSIMLVSGTITLDGVVEEDVVCIASDVIIGKNAVIKRDLFIIGGSLSKDESAKVGGEFFYFKFDLKKIESSIMPFLSNSKTISFIKTLKVVLWFIIALIVFAIFPLRIDAAKDLFDKYTLKIGAIGLLAMFSFIFLLFTFIILSFVFIGIPLLIALILLYFIIFIFGRTVMFYYLGIKIADFFKMKKLPPAVFLLIGVVLYGILKFLPLLGPVLLIILNILELGIGISYFLRKKLKL